MNASTRTGPPIPTTCAHNPTTPDGLVVPWANVQLADGGCDFRSHHNTRWQQCWTERLCQVCGDHLTRPAVLLCGPRQLAKLLFDEPALHPECARYVAAACPMVAGQRSHYRSGPTVAHRTRGATCPDPGCDCGGWVPTPGMPVAAGGDPAHQWYAVYVTDYQVAARPDGTLIGGVCHPDHIRRVRAVSEPGTSYARWRDVSDWRDRYRAPDHAQAAS